MATAPDDSITSKISEELSCQICVDTYTEPKSLPCLHTFCRHCIATYVKKQSPGDGQYPCPICRANFSLPKTGIDGLPTNFMYNNLAELLGQKKKAEPKELLCDSCYKPAVGWCRECDENLCKECVDAHTRVKVTRNHGIVALESPAETDDCKKTLECESSDSPQWFCDSHSSQTVTCVCLQCELPLCPFCISNILTQKSHQHKTHDIVGVEEAVTRFMDDIETRLDTLKERVTDVDEGLTSLTELDTSLTELEEQTKKDVTARCKEITSTVDRWRTKTLKDLETECQKTRDELHSKKALLDGYGEKLHEETQQINTVLNSDDPKVVLRRQELEQKIKILDMSTVYDQTSLPQPLTVSWSNTEGDVKSKVNSLLGSLLVEKVERAAPLQRFDSQSSLASANSESAAKKRRPKKSRTPSINVSLLTTYRVRDVVMVGMAIGQNSGDFFAVDSKEREIYQFTLNNENRFHMVKKFGAKGLREPLDVDQLPDGRVVVSDGKLGHCVKVFDTSGEKYTLLAHSILKKACGVTTTPEGHVLVTDVDEQAIHCLKSEDGSKFTKNWTIDDLKGKKQFDNPQYVACSTGGMVVVTDRKKNFAKGFHPDGRFKFSYGRFGAKPGQMKKPEGVCIDSQGRVYVMDVGNNRVHVLNPRGQAIGVIDVPKVCGKFDPPPSMIAVTKNGHLVLGNDQGWVKILQVEVTGHSSQSGEGDGE